MQDYKITNTNPQWIGTDRLKVLWPDGRIFSSGTAEWHQIIQPWLNAGGEPEQGTNWEGFLQAWQTSGLDNVLSTSSDERNLSRLDLAFRDLANYSPGSSVVKLKQYWNKVVAGLVVPLTATQIDQANQIASVHQVPLTLNSEGRFIDQE